LSVKGLLITDISGG